MFESQNNQSVLTLKSLKFLCTTVILILCCLAYLWLPHIHAIFAPNYQEKFDALNYQVSQLSAEISTLATQKLNASSHLKHQFVVFEDFFMLKHQVLSGLNYTQNLNTFLNKYPITIDQLKILIKYANNGINDLKKVDQTFIIDVNNFYRSHSKFGALMGWINKYIKIGSSQTQGNEMATKITKFIQNGQYDEARRTIQVTYTQNLDYFKNTLALIAEYEQLNQELSLIHDRIFVQD